MLLVIDRYFPKAFRLYYAQNPFVCTTLVCTTLLTSRPIDKTPWAKWELWLAGNRDINALIDHWVSAPLSARARRQLRRLFEYQRDQVLKAKLSELSRFILANGRLPAANARDAEGQLTAEGKLGGWVSSNGTQEGLHPQISSEARAVLDARFRPSLEELNHFILTHGRWPSAHRRDAAGQLSSEGKLGQWVGSQGGQEAVYPQLSHEARATIDASFSPSLEELNRFIITHGRWPRGKDREGDQLSKEGKLGKWASRNGGRETLHPQLSSEARATLDAIFKPSLEELNRFIVAHGRWPNSKAREASGNLANEGKLGNWVTWSGNQTGLYPELSPEAREALGPVPSPLLRELSLFIVENRRWPNRRARDSAGQPNAEGKLGQRVASRGGQKSLYPQLSPEARAASGLTFSPSLDELNRFIIEKKRWPKRNARDAEGKLSVEGKLDSWVGRNGGQAGLYPRLSSEARRILDAEFRPSLEELNRFIVKKGHWPRTNLRDAEGKLNAEGKLGAWVNNNGTRTNLYARLSQDAKDVLDGIGWSPRNKVECGKLQDRLDQAKGKTVI